MYKKEIQHKLINNLLIRILIIFFCVFYSSCSGLNQPKDVSHPLYLGCVYDVSASVEKLGLSRLEISHIDEMIKILEIRGGEIAFGLIDENAFAPLTRLELLPVVGYLDERAKRGQRNRQQIQKFRTEAETKLNRPRNAPYTDITGSLARFSLFFSEPNIPSNAEKVLLFISDGIDTGPWRKLLIRLPEEVKVYCIGTETGLAKKLFGEHAILFEGIEAAIKNLGSNIGEGDK